ncbi:hypothetical protein [Paenibacillus caui]|uniref:hypothetical protein n=1 Tax=Paenibacillus caui TaxID=2873927 RepID=UPI001CA8AA30|nr:hypothetical protein [Paenibacillus caui]
MIMEPQNLDLVEAAAAHQRLEAEQETLGRGREDWVRSFINACIALGVLATLSGIFAVLVYWAR